MRMRFTSRLGIAVGCAVLCLACVPQVASAAGAAAEPKLLRVEILTYGLCTGVTTVDLVGCSVEVLDMRQVHGDWTWCVTRFAISEKERNDLSRAVRSAGLRDFRPKAAWFKPPAPLVPDAQGNDLSVKWQDAEVVLWVPPEYVEKRLTRDRRMTYTRMHALEAMVWALERKHSARATHRAVASDGPELAAMHREIERVSALRLPADPVFERERGSADAVGGTTGE